MCYITNPVASGRVLRQSAYARARARKFLSRSVPAFQVPTGRPASEGACAYGPWSSSLRVFRDAPFSLRKCAHHRIKLHSRCRHPAGPNSDRCARAHLRCGDWQRLARLAMTGDGPLRFPPDAPRPKTSVRETTALTRAFLVNRTRGGKEKRASALHNGFLGCAHALDRVNGAGRRLNGWLSLRK